MPINKSILTGEIRRIIFVLVLIAMVLLGLVSIFVENFQNPQGAFTSVTVTSFILGKKLGDKYYSIKRKVKGTKEFFR